MEGKEFAYQNFGLRCVLVLPIVGIAFFVEYLLSAQLELKLAYRLLILAVALVLAYLWYRLMGSFSFLQKRGTYGTQGGNLWIQKGKRNRTLLSDVYEVYISEKNMLGVRITLLQVKYGKSQLELYSIPMKPKEGYKDTDLYLLFQKVLARNPKLHPNQDAFGSTTGSWYKI